jgi:hypothetical protein
VLAYRLASAHNLTVLADIEQDLRQTVNYTAQDTVTTMARKALHR